MLRLEENNHLYDIRCPICGQGYDVHTDGEIVQGHHKGACPKCKTPIIITIYVDYMVEIVQDEPYLAKSKPDKEPHV